MFPVWKSSRNRTGLLETLWDSSSFTCTASVQLGDGQGNFQPASTSQTFPCIGPGPAQLADLDGDGKPDLVLSIQQAHAAYTSLLWFKNEDHSAFSILWS